MGFFGNLFGKKKSETAQPMAEPDTTQEEVVTGDSTETETPMEEQGAEQPKEE